jgi:hypothetical protein
MKCSSFSVSQITEKDQWMLAMQSICMSSKRKRPHVEACRITQVLPYFDISAMYSMVEKKSGLLVTKQQYDYPFFTSVY